MSFCRARRAGLLGAALYLAAAVYAQTERAAPAISIEQYIKQTWGTLTRSNKNLAKAAVDPKFQPLPNGRWPVYVSQSEDLVRVEHDLPREMAAQDFEKIEIRRLPADLGGLREQGLLYLPHPYVVPGGRFNEMYGWDSYFIQVGLLRDGEIDRAKDMADNFLYEIRNYGKILNANRTYYMTRSQPPFLTQMILGVYQKTHDRKWLEDTIPAIDSYYRFWTSEPHLTKETGLSRYFDLGEGPAPEVLSSEKDEQGRTHYDLVKLFYRTHEITDYDITQYYERNADRLTPLFYKGDRSMRESGFDPSNRFGPFNIDIIHYNPVCLNALLYLMESQAAEISDIVKRTDDAGIWRKRATERAAKINRLLWDSRDGLYYDYDFVNARLRRYPFLTTFYPLWAGVATADQAARVRASLPLFERAGGLQTSTQITGNQWDAPFGWAPLQMIAVEGLRRYGYAEDADRISKKFISMLVEDFSRRGTIVEKYDVVRRGSNVSGGISFGYRSNEAGFGWTNAVFNELYDQLPPRERTMAAPASR